GTTPHAPDYNVAIDQFQITEGSNNFDDTFASTVPPNGPSTFGPYAPGATTYFTYGTFNQGANSANMPGSNAVPLPFLQAVQSNPYSGHQAYVPQADLNYAQS